MPCATGWSLRAVCRTLQGECADPPITVTLDNSNDTGMQVVTLVQARDMLREAGL